MHGAGCGKQEGDGCSGGARDQHAWQNANLTANKDPEVKHHRRGNPMIMHSGKIPAELSWMGHFREDGAPEQPTLSLRLGPTAL